MIIHISATFLFKLIVDFSTTDEFTDQVKKREFRTMWIQRINASARMYGMPYSMFVNSLNRSNITLNRKVLSELAVNEPLSFKAVFAVAKENKAMLQ